MNFTYAIALTGGIATGKTTVGKILKKQGFGYVDLDIIAHELLDVHEEKIALMFGDEFVKNGKVDRKSLGKLIFSDKKAKEELEGFLHPLIKQSVIEKAQDLEKLKKPYFVDIPLFFETKSYDIKNVVLVYAPKKLQLKRLMKRSNLSESEAKNMIKSQMDIEEKLKLASFVLDNSLYLQNLEMQMEKLNKWIKDLYASSKI